MSAQLVPVTAGTFPTIPLQRPILLIGRHPECDIRFNLPKISRRHCCVALAYDRVVIRDLGSRNGLRVNGRVVDEAQLLPGDELAIGPILYRVDLLSPATSTANSRPAAAPPAELPKLPSDSDDLIPLDF